MLLSNSVFNNNDYNILSSKNDVILFKSKNENNSYRISFNISSATILKENIKPNKYVNLKLYEILEFLNKDVIEKIEYKKLENENDSYLILFKFNHLGKEFGMKKKYMLTTVKFVNSNDNNYAGIVSKYAKLENNEISDYDEIKCENSNLLAFTYEGGIGVYYDFKIEVLDELPNYMKDFGAMLMKKIFIRMREYILNDLDRSN